MATANTPLPADFGNIAHGSSWAEKYGEKHTLSRIKEVPGVILPQKVRIYSRGGHHVLQWWDPSLKKTLSQRVDGDLLDAIVAAREIEERLLNRRSTGPAVSRISFEEAVTAFISDLRSRADAGEIDPGTVERYGAPLRRHFLAFVGQPTVSRKYSHVAQIDRAFYLEFAKFLQSRHVSPNGSPNAATRPMQGQQYVLDVVRSMLHWAADESRGRLLPRGFLNPFRRSTSGRERMSGQGISEPDITIPMAAELLSACDSFQLPAFATLTLYGLRPNELGWMFREDSDDDWVRVCCHPALGYQTKGRRDKQFPVVEPLRAVWPQSAGNRTGLLFRRRGDSIAAMPVSKQALIKEFHGGHSNGEAASVAERRSIRDEVMSKAGQLTYDHLEGEFHRLAKKLNWPKAATLKDFRHLFATNLENAGVPDGYRRFLMGHSPGRSAIVTYTHLNKLRDHYYRALGLEFKPVLDVLVHRAASLDGSNVDILSPGSGQRLV